jgi:hypothetical protein
MSSITIAAFLAMSTEEQAKHLQPNCFHLIHSVEEGDNRAGGWSKPKTMIIKDLGELARYKTRRNFKIIEVKPAFEFSHQFNEVVSQETIDNAIHETNKVAILAGKQANIEKAKKNLAKAESELNA